MGPFAARQPRLLLVNPVIFDFAAYDFWARPLGLLTLAGLLKKAGAHVNLLDCTDPRSPWLSDLLRPRRKGQGQGKLARTPVPRPRILPPLDRRYARYGLPPWAMVDALGDHEQPDAVLVTSMMTYWYPGVIETIGLIRERWPDLPVFLGGVYATLCSEHARRHSGADLVIPGPAEHAMGEVFNRLCLEVESGAPQGAMPAHDLCPDAEAAPLLTSVGCPYACSYCGVKRLHSRYIPRPVQQVLEEVRHIVNDLDIHDIALYDDAFLAEPRRAAEILERIADMNRPLRLHSASGLSCRGLTPRVARAMKRAGLVTLRLGLETADPESQLRLGNKVTSDELGQALDNLAAAGYPRRSIGVYVMAGLPGQDRAEVERSLDLVFELGARPHLAEYSPVPTSPLFAEANRASLWDLQAEPLFHNPTLMPCAGSSLDRQALSQIKRELRSRTGPPAP